MKGGRGPVRGRAARGGALRRFSRGRQCSWPGPVAARWLQFSTAGHARLPAQRRVGNEATQPGNRHPLKEGCGGEGGEGLSLGPGRGAAAVHPARLSSQETRPRSWQQLSAFPIGPPPTSLLSPSRGPGQTVVPLPRPPLSSLCPSGPPNSQLPLCVWSSLDKQIGTVASSYRLPPWAQGGRALYLLILICSIEM